MDASVAAVPVGLFGVVLLAFFGVARMGVIYLVAALVLNGVFIWWSIKLYRKPTTRTAWGMFRFSIYYLALLFLAMAVDQLVTGW